MQRQATGTSVDASPNVFKVGDRVVVYNKQNVRIHGVVRWVGKSPANSVAAGIETVSVCDMNVIALNISQLPSSILLRLLF